jgi:hypothetical protein
MGEIGMATAVQEGKYIYCIIGSSEPRSFGPLGIGGRGDSLHAVVVDDVAAVVSDAPLTRYRVSRENTLAHQKAIEAVMCEQPVLPVRFATIAEDEEKVRRILQAEYDSFKQLLAKVSDKVELGLKAIFVEDIVYGRILAKYENIRTIKERLATLPPDRTHYERMRIGKMVEEALQAEKQLVADDILSTLSPFAAEVKTNDTYGELMILNAAFFVPKCQEADFDRQVQGLGEKYAGNVQFKYVGTMPPFNFVNLIIQMEKY